MQENRKKWISLGIALASGVSINAMAADMPDHSGHSSAMTLAAAGEGEGEGAGVTETDLKTNDIAYLTRLGLIRGHLLVGYELYRQGHTDKQRLFQLRPVIDYGCFPVIPANGVWRFR